MRTLFAAFLSGTLLTLAQSSPGHPLAGLAQLKDFKSRRASSSDTAKGMISASSMAPPSPSSGAPTEDYFGDAWLKIQFTTDQELT